MVERHWPIFEEKHWACSFAEIDWKSEGIGSAKLDYLLWSRGWFHDGHRALSDAEAALFLLTLPLPQSGRPALAAMLESARRPLRAVRAEDTAFEQRAALKARGRRGEPAEGWKLTDDAEAEIDWLHAEIYGDQRNVRVVNMPATRRYSSRLWPA